MPIRDWKIRIKDILICIDKVSRYIEGMNEDDFLADNRTIDAVLRNIEIVGEAARHIPEEIQNRYPELPLLEMRGMRNVVAHEYFGISLSIIWKTAVNDLPQLKPVLEEILIKEDK